MSNILDCMPLGEEIEIRGPTGEIVYNGNGKFIIEDQERTFKRISLVLGGSGITPGYALIARTILEDAGVEVRVVDANKSEKDILLKEELDWFVEKGKGRLRVEHILSHPSSEWKGKKGHVDEELIKSVLFDPKEEGSVVFLCGPPGMIQKAALPALKDWGYEEDVNCFGF